MTNTIIWIETFPSPRRFAACLRQHGKFLQKKKKRENTEIETSLSDLRQQSIKITKISCELLSVKKVPAFPVVSTNTCIYEHAMFTHGEYSRRVDHNTSPIKPHIL